MWLIKTIKQIKNKFHPVFPQRSESKIPRIKIYYQYGFRDEPKRSPTLGYRLKADRDDIQEFIRYKNSCFEANPDALEWETNYLIDVLHPNFFENLDEIIERKPLSNIAVNEDSLYEIFQRYLSMHKGTSLRSCITNISRNLNAEIFYRKNPDSKSTKRKSTDYYAPGFKDEPKRLPTTGYQLKATRNEIENLIREENPYYYDKNPDTLRKLADYFLEELHPNCFENVDEIISGKPLSNIKLLDRSLFEIVLNSIKYRYTINLRTLLEVQSLLLRNKVKTRKITE